MLFSWNIFWLFALVSLLLWAAGAIVAFLRGRQCRRLSLGLTLAGLAVYVAFIIGLWTSLGRPPLRTLGETRLWYSLFMMASGWLVYRLWRYRWILSFSLIVAAVFIIINLAHPDIHDQSLMPALQSAWFVPHVTAYIFSYSLFGCSFLMAVIGLWRHTDAICLRPTDSSASASFSSPSVCFRVASGPSRLGATIGLGTPKRLGPRPRGVPVCSMCICA